MCWSCCKAVKTWIDNLKETEQVQRCLAFYSMSLYFVDVGSDSYNGYELWIEEHIYFSILTIGIIFLPGIIGGIFSIIDGVKKGDLKRIVLGITAPVWLIPVTAWSQLKNVWTLSEDSKKDAKK